MLKEKHNLVGSGFIFSILKSEEKTWIGKAEIDIATEQVKLSLIFDTLSTRQLRWYSIAIEACKRNASAPPRAIMFANKNGAG